MRHTHVLPALLSVAAAILAGCGNDTTSHDSAPGGTSVSANAVDRAFIAEMAPHHRSAVQMAKIAQQRGQSAFVKHLADDIVRTQDREIDLMRSEDMRLAAAGINRGSLGVAEHMMGMSQNSASLQTASPFDKAFLSMMIPHHEGAIVMAKAELANGKDRKLKTLAKSIINAQQGEITAMRKHLRGDDQITGDPHHDAGHSG